MFFESTKSHMTEKEIKQKEDEILNGAKKMLELKKKELEDLKREIIEWEKTIEFIKFKILEVNNT